MDLTYAVALRNSNICEAGGKKRRRMERYGEFSDLCCKSICMAQGDIALAGLENPKDAEKSGFQRDIVKDAGQLHLEPGPIFAWLEKGRSLQRSQYTT